MADTLKPAVLVVEDEPSQREILTYNLQAEGFAVRTAHDGEEALLCVAEAAPDLILLDWMLPIVSGIEVCRQLKSRAATNAIPVIMLSARSEDTDKVRGLDTGADDYLTKPYSVSELVARVRAQLRRSRPSTVGQTLRHDGVVVDTEKHLVRIHEADVKLGPTEYRLLCTLIEKPGRVWTREMLLDRVWGRELHVDTRTVDVHVGRLRKALTQNGASDPIRTVRGAGYALG
ncbi:phosphate regulon transcriptional regulator PhoB [Algirhabdus cladophorae]|uniref:phosphate regulon transcriptional regulator PhoB n=1 Tax=Algirhabdus cladophorae TaxID=3377108 RepID=UPI003B849C49